jgi:hypothetical protein
MRIPPCIRCGTQEKGGRAQLLGPPFPSLAFYTRGSDESSAFSPGDHQADLEHLVVRVCDECLVQAGHEGRIMHGSLQALVGSPLPGEWEYTEWRYIPPAAPLQSLFRGAILLTQAEKRPA